MNEINVANIYLNDTRDLNILSALGKLNFPPPLVLSMLQSLINNTNILFIITDPKGIIHLFSPGAEIIMGYKACEVIKKLSIIELCDPQDLIERTNELNFEFNSKIKPGLSTIVFHAVKGIEDHCTIKFIHKKGQDIQIEASITRLLNETGDLYGYIISGTESHFSLQDETIQNEINRRVITYIANAPTGVFIANSKGNFIHINKAACEAIGYTKKELLCMNLSELINPKDRERAIESFQNLLTVGHSITACGFIKKHGEKRYWIVNAAKINTDSYLGIINDVTDLKNNEKELIRAKLVAEAKNSAKNNFIANISHEIKNPLNAIIGFSEILLSTKQEEKQLSQISAINKSGKNLLKILNDILDLSKIEADRIKLEPVPVNLNAMFTDIEILFNEKINEKGLTFTVEKDADITYNHILDENRLRQILFNLIGNAIKFTEKGSITLTYWSVLINENNVKLTILIRDTGIGIPRNQQRLIFVPFHQQDHQNFNKYGGTGLGLSISKHLTEKMGGEIKVISEPGKGSIFKVMLPCIEIQPNEESLNILPQNEIAFDQITELTDEQKRHLPEVIQVLENEFLPLSESVIKKQLIENIEIFGKTLIAYGEANFFQIITDYGKKICHYVDNFEIDNMMKTLKAFPEFIKNIKSLNCNILLILQTFLITLIEYQFI